MSQIVFTRERCATAGPWMIGEIKNRADKQPNALAVWPEKTVKARKRGAAICVVSAVEDVTVEDEDNAYLIAAAPDLLSAVRRLLDVHQVQIDQANERSNRIRKVPRCECGACVEGRAAISKACGERYGQADLSNLMEESK